MRLDERKAGEYNFMCRMRPPLETLQGSKMNRNWIVLIVLIMITIEIGRSL